MPAAAAGSSPGKAIAPLQTPSSDLLASRPLNIRSHVACPISQSIMKQVRPHKLRYILYSLPVTFVMLCY